MKTRPAAILTLVALLVVATVTIAATNTPQPPAGTTVTKMGDGEVWTSSATYTPPPSCADSQQAITHYRQLYTAHRQKMNASPAVPRVWYHKCDVVRRRAVEWRHRAQTARAQLANWTNDRYRLPPTNDWRTSVRLAQRIYPGTDQWLLHISDREGGWGPFVMNHQGSGAGGWLQFMSGTFYAYVDDARRDVQRKGFKVPPGVWTWTHPLGQALTGAYMRFTGRDGCHWCSG